MHIYFTSVCWLIKLRGFSLTPVLYSGDSLSADEIHFSCSWTCRLQYWHGLSLPSSGQYCYRLYLNLELEPDIITHASWNAKLTPWFSGARIKIGCVDLILFSCDCLFSRTDKLRFMLFQHLFSQSGWDCILFFPPVCCLNFLYCYINEMRIF